MTGREVTRSEKYWTWCDKEITIKYPCIKICRKRIKIPFDGRKRIKYPCVKICKKKKTIKVPCRKTRDVIKWEQSFCWVKCMSYIFYRSCEGCDWDHKKWSWGGASFSLPGMKITQSDDLGKIITLIFDLDDKPTEQSGSCDCDDLEIGYDYVDPQDNGPGEIPGSVVPPESDDPSPDDQAFQTKMK